ncbi:hypothetical protein RRF57_011362 [Xylaria bambusicola]|uniref:Uncharacterized protein n=1 Tax=Xylaria bambusicola TaxID=326684 RepID=A0AAN7UMQ0_9PEZI
MELLRRGADPCIVGYGRGQRYYNVFQTAAIHSPRLLLQILDAMASNKVPMPHGLNVEAILSASGSDEDIFALLVYQGTLQHLQVADELRIKFKVHYDNLVISARSKLTAWVPGRTLTGHLAHHHHHRIEAQFLNKNACNS